MAEVFSISGAGFGASCPAGFATTPKGNCQGSAGAALQNALASLGRTVRDGSLMAIAVDGSIGPLTAAGVNQAFTKHIGPGQAPPQLRTGGLSIFDVAANAPTLTQIIAAEVNRRGGTLTTTRPPSSGGGGGPMVPAPPGAYPEPSTGGGLSAVTWMLIGLGVIVGGAGLYFAFRGDGGGARRARYA